MKGLHRLADVLAALLGAYENCRLFFTGQRPQKHKEGCDRAHFGSR